MRAVEPDYTAQAGETVFPDYATDEQLERVFPGHLADKEAQLIKAKLSELEKSMHDYIEAHYNTQWKIYLLSAHAAPGCSASRKKAIESAWAWGESVVEYYSTLAAKLVGGASLPADKTDWAAHFDASDPGLTLLNLPK